MTRKQFLVPLFISAILSATWTAVWFLQGQPWIAVTVPVISCIMTIRWVVIKYGARQFIEAGLREWKLMMGWNIAMFFVGVWAAWSNLEWWEYAGATGITVVVSALVGRWVQRKVGF